MAGAVIFCWFVLGNAGTLVGVLLAEYCSGNRELVVLDLFAIALVGRALGDFLCGFVLGRFLRRIRPWYVLGGIVILHTGMLLYFVHDSGDEMPTVPLPLIPLILAAIFIVCAGIKVGRQRQEWIQAVAAGTTLGRPWFQFSLRSLMLFVSLCAVVLASWYTFLEPFRRQERTIATIENRWGNVEIEQAGPPTVLERLIGERYTGDVVAVATSQGYGGVPFTEDELFRLLEGMDQLRGLSLLETQITDDGLARLKRFPKLEDLMLNHTAISGEGLRYLRGLPALTSLDLGSTRITDRSLVHLESLPDLLALSLGYNQIGDEGLAHLEPLKKLTWLCLSETNITDRGVVHLQHLSALECLMLSDTQIRGEGLIHLRNLKNLRILGLSNTQITDSALAHLKELTSLEDLYLYDCPVTAEGVDKLQKTLPDCEIRYRRPAGTQ